MVTSWQVAGSGVAPWLGLHARVPVKPVSPVNCLRHLKLSQTPLSGEPRLLQPWPCTCSPTPSRQGFPWLPASAGLSQTPGKSDSFHPPGKGQGSHLFPPGDSAANFKLSCVFTLLQSSAFSGGLW